MPIIPRTPVERVPTAPLPGYRPRSTASIENFGGGEAAAQTARQASGLTGDIQKFAIQEHQKRLDIEFDDFDARDVQEEISGKTKLSKVRGKDADAAAGRALQDFDSSHEERIKDVTDQSQYQRLQQRHKLRRSAFEAFATGHAMREQERFDDDTADAKLAAEHNAAVLADPMSKEGAVRIALALDMQEETLAKYAQRKGMPPEELANRLARSESAIHRELIEGMNKSGRDLDAKKYFEAMKGRLWGDDLKAVQGEVTKHSYLGEAQRLSDEFTKPARVEQPETEWRGLKLYTPAKYVPPSLAEAREKWMKIEDPKLRAMVEDLSKERLQEQAVITKQERARQFEEDFNLVDKTGTVDQIPLERWASYNHEEKKELAAWAKREGDPQTDDTVYYPLKLMAAHPETRQRFMGENLLLHRSKLSKSDFDELVKDQAALLKGDSGDLDGYRTTEGIVTGTVAGRITGVELEKFRRIVDDDIRKEQKRAGKKEVPNERVQEIVDGLLRNETRALFGIDWLERDPRAYELRPEEKAVEKTAQEKIPTDERRKIEEALRKAGKPATEENVLRFYRMKLEQAVKNAAK